MKYSMTWNLENIFAGGAQSEALNQELQLTSEKLKALEQLLDNGIQSNLEAVIEATELVSECLFSIREMDAFVSCLMAQNMQDKQAIFMNDKVKNLIAAYTGMISQYDYQLSIIDADRWNNYMEHEALKPLAFNLTEKRELAKRKMAPELEALAAELAIDGYHGWGDFYNTIVAQTNFEWLNENGELESLSAGQMANKLDEPNRELRSKAFEIWEEGWAKQSEYAADVLNHIAGFRLKWYEKRRWNAFMEEPLAMNRMSKQTLDAMWSAVEKAKHALIPYFERKAELFQLPKLDWHDVSAPIASSGAKISFDDAADFIVEQFAVFSEELASFAKMAFNEAWIEAEDRKGKRPGGFCTSLPKSGETRIFMTYSGTTNNVSTLAHELGHAYHQHVMKDMPALTQEYAMNVAETASTFAELIVTDKALQQAESKQEKLALVEEKIQNAIAFYMNIHARFLYETAFFEERKNGPLTKERITELMLDAQDKAYLGLLGEKHPHFWAAKLHFYLTDVPFYNFPYTFGYLFSAGIYQRALQKGPSFAASYDALLQDTGRMSVEELAQKHLGVDLTETHFWEEAAKLVENDVQLFLSLTDTN